MLFDGPRTKFLPTGSRSDWPCFTPANRLGKILRLRLRISPADSRSASVSLAPANRLKMQRGTFEGSLAVRSIRKRPDARHFVWHELLHPPCHSIATGNKR